MRKPLILFGNNDFARMLKRLAEKESGWKVAAFTVDEKYIKEPILDGVPVVPYEQVARLYPPVSYDMLVTSGYHGMNELRKKVFLECREWGYAFPNYIHPSVVMEEAVLGEGNILLEGVVLAYGCRLGDGNILFAKTEIGHESVIDDFNFFSVGVVTGGKTRIMNNCFFGLNSTVLGGWRTIGDYTLVGAGAYVNQATEPYSVYVPAKSICLEGKDSREML